MPAPFAEIITAQTKNWINTVVVGCGFCPFAAKEMKRGSVHYGVLYEATLSLALQTIMRSIHQLDNENNIETTLLIFPDAFASFDTYLHLVETAEDLLAREKYEGTYQIAGFHPQYLFAGSHDNDPANYTNRSPYPMIQLLREDSVGNAVDNYNVDEIPHRNISFAHAKGLDYMKKILAACMDIN